MKQPRIYKSKYYCKVGNREIDMIARESTNDGDCIRACMSGDEYTLAELLKDLPPEKREFAVDVGAHIGGFTLALLHAGFKKVVSVEAVPDNAQILQENIRMNNFHEQSLVFPFPIGETDGAKTTVTWGVNIDNPNRASQEMHAYMGGSMSSGVLNGMDSVKTTAVSLNYILQQVPHCNMVKMDCEGAEWGAFKSLTAENYNKIDYIFGEVHLGSYSEGRKHDDFIQLLKGNWKDVTKELNWTCPEHRAYKNMR